MDQIKTGKFIAGCRKRKNLTQMQLAEKLGITDRAISKWETGKSLPDSSIMLELCEILGIQVNELLSGEELSVENYNKELENNLLEMIRQKEQADKRLLKVECVMGVLCIIPLLSAVILVYALSLPESAATAVMVAALIPLLIATPFAIKIEQTAGYYACAECGNKYIPSYKSVFFAAHMGTTRRMKCPKCGRKSWQKKVLSKE